MDFLSLLWFVLIFVSMVQPALQRRMLEWDRQRWIERIERQRGSRVITLVHRQESMGLLGFPIMRYIDVNDSEEVLRAIELTDPQVPIDLVLHTPGGLVLASLQIARALRRHPGGTRVIVPHYAMSGGTLIALAADEIIMSPHAVLGPVDPQIGQYPAASLLAVLEKKPLSEVDDQTLILADVARKAVQQLQDAVYELLAGRYPEEQARGLAQKLSEGYWTHDYPITYEKARELGLRVSCDIPKEFLHLMALYPQPVRHQVGVEYLPIPRYRERGSRREGE
ncbi:MAG: ATP-dependent Clp protease proteolytic subunit [Candidatus Bipolaricaulota bacterium]|nr:ATP-dependent Clp protease proteolytic subunit [Candidatus Bipolaricaulota bacterium]MDW8329674.1 ATP-dependent Clp protease proteolytic subunit [Candidatus Bipolaricaulota bacterium]